MSSLVNCLSQPNGTIVKIGCNTNYECHARTRFFSPLPFNAMQDMSPVAVLTALMNDLFNCTVNDLLVWFLG